MEEDKFNFLTEQFDDIKILRYQVPAFGQLPLREKIFVYYLSQAALAGRDILWDQNNRYNLRIRKILERIVREYPGDRNTDEFGRFLIYTKKVFFANGIHHHYSMDKFIPGFSKTYFQELLASIGIPEVFPELERVMFDSGYMAKRVVLDEGKDLIRASANNYYMNVTQREVEEKMISNIKEVKARGARVILVCRESDNVDPDAVDLKFGLPEFDDLLMPMIAVVPLQLIAYYTSVLKGNDVDKPRNLAKSVTVE